MSMFMVLSSWAQPLWEFRRFIWWTANWTPGGRQPSDQANWLGLRVRPLAATDHIHHRHVLLLLVPKADTHVTFLQTVER